MTNDAGHGQSRRWRRFAILAAVLISAAGWLRLRVDNSLEPLLPDHSAARQTVLFFRDSSFGRTAILWFSLQKDGTTSDLYAASDAAEKMFDPRLIVNVVHPPAESSAMDQMFGLLDNPGELLNENDLADLKQAIEPAALNRKMAQDYRQLLQPQGEFFAPVLRRDPLGITTRILGRLQSLSSGMGYNVQIKDGRFMNPNGRELMLILQTASSATSLSGSREIAEHLENVCDAAAATVDNRVHVVPICAQIHTEQNDQMMQHDIHRAAILNTIAFLLLFLLVSRDFRVGIVFMLPLATTAIAMGWCALATPDLSTMMLGLAVTMAGSAVDYGIFVYTAVAMGSVDRAQVRRLWRPLVISHLTTLGVFIALLFSNIPGFRQLGYLTSISLVLSLLAAIFALPKMIRPGGKLALLGRGMSVREWGRITLPVSCFLFLLFAAGVWEAKKIGIDPDITRLDGASAQVKQAELDFQKTWGEGDQAVAILAVTEKTRAEAEQANDQICQLIQPHFSDGQFTSLSNFWPSQAQREANEARWRDFWSADRIAQFKHDLAAAAAQYDFAPDAFSPFLKAISNPPSDQKAPSLIQSMEARFVARAGDDWQMLNYFPDTSQNTTMVQSLLDKANITDAAVVSRIALSQAFAESASSEARLLMAISLAFIILSLLILTQSITKSAVVLLPAATGIIAMLAALVLGSMSISIVTVIAAIIVLALGTDYGVFALYAWERGEAILGQAMSSVHLSFLTTLAGTSAMLLAHHPALFLVGVSLTTGLLAAYATALFMIPTLGYLLDRKAA